MNDLINSLEADAERISGGKTNKKSKEQLERLDVRLKKNIWHVDKLELIIRLLDNDRLDPDAVDNIVDDVEYYVESAKDDDGSSGVDDEFDIYEELGMEVDAKPNEEESAASASVSCFYACVEDRSESYFVIPTAVPTAANSGIGIPTIGKGAKKATDTLSSIGKPAQTSTTKTTRKGPVPASCGGIYTC